MFFAEKSCCQNQDRAKGWKNIFCIFLYWILNRNKLPPKPRSCQKLEKIKFSILFKIELWMEKNCHQNQDCAKSWKNQFLNTFSIEFWIETSCHQNQDRAKSWKNQFSNTFEDWIVNKLPHLNQVIRWRIPNLTQKGGSKYRVHQGYGCIWRRYRFYIFCFFGRIIFTNVKSHENTTHHVSSFILSHPNQMDKPKSDTKGRF